MYVLIAFTREEPCSATCAESKPFLATQTWDLFLCGLDLHVFLLVWTVWHHLCASPLPPPSRLGSAAQKMRAIPGGRACSQRADKPLSGTCDCRGRSAASFPSVLILPPVRGYQPPLGPCPIAQAPTGVGVARLPSCRCPLLCPVIHDMLMPWDSVGF